MNAGIAINYQHLFYFYRVSCLGSVSAAARELRLRQPTVSTQLRLFQDSLGVELFVRRGRYLTLTEQGELVQKHAAKIFAQGSDMIRELSGEKNYEEEPLRIGVTDAVPKFLIAQLIKPFLLQSIQQVVVIEDRPDKLLLTLASHEIDFILSETNITSSVAVRAFNHPLGSSGISFMGSPHLLRGQKRRFPTVLAELPLVLPLATSALRERLERWFASVEIVPRIIAEIEDSALAIILAQEKMGLVVVPTALEKVVKADLGLEAVGRLSSVIEEYFVVSLERQVKNPVIEIVMKEANKFF